MEVLPDGDVFANFYPAAVVRFHSDSRKDPHFIADRNAFAAVDQYRPAHVASQSEPDSPQPQKAGGEPPPELLKSYHC